jgi:hypothetical protein
MNGTLKTHITEFKCYSTKRFSSFVVNIPEISATKTKLSKFHNCVPHERAKLNIKPFIFLKWKDSANIACKNRRVGVLS